MNSPIHRSLLVALLSLLFASGPVLAQSEAQADAEQDTTAKPNTPAEASATSPSLASSLTVGYLNTDFSYGDSTATAYDFDGPLATLMLSWQHGSLALSYGSSNATSIWPALRTAGASFWLGGDVYIFKSLFRVPLAAYVPIRFNARYRYASLDEDDAPAGDPGRPTLHLVGSGLGAGGGARFTLPIGPSFIKDDLTVQASYVLAPGLIGNVGKSPDAAESLERPLDELKLRWATDLNVEIQFKDLLGNSVGVTAGYTLRTVSRSPEKPGSFGDVLDAFFDRSDFAEVSDQHIFRVGINW